MKRMELLSPAGTLKAMRYAFAYGADAVYAGQPRYSLRVRENEFNKMEVMQQAIDEAHQLGKLFYLASNIAPHNLKVRSYLKNIEPVIAMKPDALIMSDPGLIMMVRDRWPDVPIHLSVQANAVNFATVKFWKNFGLTRIILSRELSLNEIREIRQECPDIELEVFVHGALCIAYSGRCLLSGYMNHRDSNQGNCTNACRWLYQVNEAKQNLEGDYDLIAREKAETVQDRVFLLEEPDRPGEFMPAFEDEHGTYIMNSKDLRAVQYVNELAEMGIDSIKIEGRTKSAFYVARTAQVYHAAIEAAAREQPFDEHLMKQLDSLSNRGYTEGFYKRQPVKGLQNYEQGVSRASRQQFVGEVTEITLLPEENEIMLLVDVKNRFDVGDSLELMTPQGNIEFTLQTMLDERNHKTEAAPGSPHRRNIPLRANGINWQEAGIEPDALKRGLFLKFLQADTPTESELVQLTM